MADAFDNNMMLFGVASLLAVIVEAGAWAKQFSLSSVARSVYLQHPCRTCDRASYNLLAKFL
jgi:hypothetical protein